MGYDYRTASPDRYNMLKEFAKRNRNYPTVAEACLWSQLRAKQLGVKFQRQHIIYDYIADFVCLDKKLIIEVDGGYHFENNQIVKDSLRSEILNDLGFEVMRFTNEEVISDTDNVLLKVKQFIKNK